MSHACEMCKPTEKTESTTGQLFFIQLLLSLKTNKQTKEQQCLQSLATNN